MYKNNESNISQIQGDIGFNQSAVLDLKIFNSQQY